jgi:hypothetical protein
LHSVVQRTIGNGPVRSFEHDKRQRFRWRAPSRNKRFGLPLL